MNKRFKVLDTDGVALNAKWVVKQILKERVSSAFFMIDEFGTPLVVYLNGEKEGYHIKNLPSHLKVVWNK